MSNTDPISQCDVKHIMTWPMKNITSELKVSTYIITNIASRSTGIDTILVISMSVLYNNCNPVVFYFEIIYYVSMNNSNTRIKILCIDYG
jgi:hypothetical protein